MFTPLSLRTFISPTPNHMNMGQQALTNVGSLVAQHQQSHQPMQQTQQTPATTRHHQAANGLPPTTNNNHTLQSHANQSQLNAININVGCVPLRQPSVNANGGAMMIPVQKVQQYISLKRSTTQNDRFELQSAENRCAPSSMTITVFNICCCKIYLWNTQFHSTVRTNPHRIFSADD